jgi:hypothetical protein
MGIQAKRLAVSLSCMTCIMASTGSVATAGVLDQHNDGPILGGTSVGVIGTALSQSAAQTLTVGLSGHLNRVEMYAYAGGTLSSPLVLEIRDAADGTPGTSILATQQALTSSTGLQWIAFDLSAANLSVSASQQLALVLRSSQDLTQGEYDAEGSHDLYPGGGSFYQSFSGPWMPLADYDLMFRTYVSATAGCSADFNHDGDIGTDQDIDAFFACLGGNCCPTCDSADFNGDGDVGTDADIESFFRVLAGGSC